MKQLITILLLLVFTSSLYSAVKNDHYYYNLGVIKTLQQRYDTGITAYCMALNKEKNNPEIYINLAESCIQYMESGQLEQNDVKKFEKFINLADVSLKILNEKISVYDHGGDVKLFRTPHSKIIKEIEKRMISALKRLKALMKKQETREIILAMRDKKSIKKTTKVTKKDIDKVGTIKDDKKDIDKVGTVKDDKKDIDKVVAVKDDKKDIDKVVAVKDDKKDIDKVVAVKDDKKDITSTAYFTNIIISADNKSIDNNFNQEKEIDELKKQMIVMVRDYLGKVEQDNKSYAKDNQKLQDKINQMKHQIIDLEKSYKDQLEGLKYEEEKEEEPAALSTTSAVIFGGLILISLIILIL
ncbi:MAG: hypothetical protein KKH98_02125 [Spirochaetes bacterium]|nr:hypothetical protein [Spirochaetota bacterium]